MLLETKQANLAKRDNTISEAVPLCLLVDILLRSSFAVVES